MNDGVLEDPAAPIFSIKYISWNSISSRLEDVTSMLPQVTIILPCIQELSGF
jgi:hypothetical protein